MKKHYMTFKALFTVMTVLLIILVLMALWIHKEPTKEELERFKQHRRSIGY